VARSIAKQGIDLKVDVVGFRVTGKARSDLQCVAREGRGDYYDADSTEDLEAGLDRLSTRAFRPFRISGTPVHGAPQQEGAPVLAPGHYSDTFGVDDTAKHYLIKRTMTGSTLRAGVSFRRPSGGRLVLQSEVKLKLLDGDQCGWSYPRAFDGDQGLATGTASSWPKYGKTECSEAEQLVLTVNPGKDFRELKGVPYELRIDEEPPVESTTTLPAAAGDPTWVPMPGTTPREIVPGSSFPDAPMLEPGSYKTTLMPGELQLYKVKADWGQRIQAQVTVPQLAGATAEAIDGIRYLDTALISPIGEDVFAVFAKKTPGTGKRAVLTKRGVTQGITTKEIRYLNRNGANNQDTGTSTAGEYYFAVSLTRKDNDQAFTVPMTVTVDLLGTAGAGKPQYVDGAAPVAGDSVTPTATPSAPSGDETEAGAPVPSDKPSDSGTPYALIGGLGGGALLLVLLGVWAVVRLRKPTPQYPNQPQYPGQYPPQGPSRNGR
jgi:Ca-activated chloride channel family protein